MEAENMLLDKLRDLLNMHSRENCSNTPDFVLAEFMISCLDAFELAVNRRDALTCQPSRSYAMDPATTPAGRDRTG